MIITIIIMINNNNNNNNNNIIIIIIIIIIMIVIIIIKIIIIILIIIMIIKFGLDKYATAEFKRGKLTKTTSVILDEETAIKELQQEDSYKYLGINEAEGIQHATMKEKIRKEYYRRVRLILKSELNAVNRIAAINSLAIPVITYSMNIINWQINDSRS